MAKIEPARVFMNGRGYVFRVPDAWRAEYMLKTGASVFFRHTLDGQLRYELRRSDFTTTEVKLRGWRSMTIVTIPARDARLLEIEKGTVLKLSIEGNGALVAVVTDE
jgi:bifunctional DNA-binding transcriptional regulator/antitoxin component of YhaV-PrlF toxin-antitoxin module